MSASAQALVKEIEPTVQHALAALVEVLDAPTTPIEDRAAAFGALYGLRRWMSRPLRGPAKTELILHMQSTGIRRMGRLSLGSRAVDPTWPINDQANWEDLTAQGILSELAESPRFSAYVRKVPEHYEIDHLPLAADVVDGLANAIALWRMANVSGWRHEASREPTLVVAR